MEQARLITEHEAAHRVGLGDQQPRVRGRGRDGEGYLRFSYANSLANLRTALAWMGEYLSVRAR